MNKQFVCIYLTKFLTFWKTRHQNRNFLCLFIIIFDKLFTKNTCFKWDRHCRFITHDLVHNYGQFNKKNENWLFSALSESCPDTHGPKQGFRTSSGLELFFGVEQHLKGPIFTEKPCVTICSYKCDILISISWATSYN